MGESSDMYQMRDRSRGLRLKGPGDVWISGRKVYGDQ